VVKTSRVLLDGYYKKSDQAWAGRNGQNKLIVFPKGNHGLKKGDYVDVRVNECTSATLIGEVV
jgi:tRNA-2-methylthio-N6-dimethylallyladenosine synthase